MWPTPAEPHHAERHPLLTEHHAAANTSPGCSLPLISFGGVLGFLDMAMNAGAPLSMTCGGRFSPSMAACPAIALLPLSNCLHHGGLCHSCPVGANWHGSWSIAIPARVVTSGGAGGLSGLTSSFLVIMGMAVGLSILPKPRPVLVGEIAE
jgi:hypothetical protein